MTSCLYDANGSLTKKDDGTNVSSYKYDARDLMTDYDGPGAGGGGVRGGLLLCGPMLCLLVLSVPALGSVYAVAAPETQTVALNGAAAEFDGSGSYAAPPPPVNYWAWDFDGDGTDDYSEYAYQGDGLTTYVYAKAGIFTVRLTAKNSAQQSGTDTQEVKVRLQVSSGELTGTSVELLWDNANNSTQFTRYEVQKELGGKG